MVDELGLTGSHQLNVPSDEFIDISTTDGYKAKSKFPYRRILGMLLYIATHIRPNIVVLARTLAIYV